jgi:hypothetical protein
MDSDDVILLHQLLDELLRRGPLLSRRFLDRLGVIDPQLKMPSGADRDLAVSVFPSALATVVSEIENLHRVMPLLRGFLTAAQAHDVPRTLTSVQAALTAAIEDSLGSRFTRDARRIVARACDHVSAALLRPPRPVGKTALLHEAI